MEGMRSDTTRTPKNGKNFGHKNNDNHHHYNKQWSIFFQFLHTQLDVTHLKIFGIVFFLSSSLQKKNRKRNIINNGMNEMKQEKALHD